MRCAGSAHVGLRGAVLVYLKMLVGCHEFERLMGSELVIEVLIVGEGAIVAAHYSLHEFNSVIAIPTGMAGSFVQVGATYSRSNSTRRCRNKSRY